MVLQHVEYIIIPNCIGVFFDKVQSDYSIVVYPPFGSILTHFKKWCDLIRKKLIFFMNITAVREVEQKFQKFFRFVKKTLVTPFFNKTSLARKIIKKNFL